MALGPAKYDELAIFVREQAQAEAVVVAVIDGNQGSGFSVLTKTGMVLRLPALLRTIADQIEAAGGHA